MDRWVSALEDAMASAAKKQHRIKEPVRAVFLPETGKFDAFIVKNVVEEVEDPLAEWDLEEARDFYTNGLGCGTGRESDHWIDFDLHGHQIVAHYKEGIPLSEL